MGTTLTAVLVDPGSGDVAIGHVGDSRAYRLRDGVLEQLTTDHSLVAELVESGVLSPEEAERHPQRSAITRALGTDPTVEVESFTVAGAAGDVFLLCSDGLSTMLSDDEVVAAVVSARGEPAAAAEALVAAANAHGGEDNITVVLFELSEEGPTAESAEQAAVPEPEERSSGTVETASDPGPGPTPAPELEPGVRRHGAGAGGRLAALLLIAAVLAVGVLLLYWGVVR
jgi:protein phosphatase